MSNPKFKITALDFSDDGFDKDSALRSLFRKVRIKAFASGENAHTLPVSVDVLKRGADTIYNQPIIWKYNPYFDDADTHTDDEVPVGFVPKEDNAIEFLEEDGKVYLVVNALLWTKYTGRLIEIFERDGGEKDVSVEMLCDTVSHGGKDEIVDYVLTGITILGEYVNPAVKGCKAEMIAFAEDKDLFMNYYEFAMKSIKIVNTKEASVDGSWENPRRKLLKPILDAPNKTALLNEAYLLPDLENPTTSTCRYPHHVVRDGKLVIHVGGLKAAFSRAAQQGIVSGKVKSHLLRHYHELGLNTENFAEFGLSKKEFSMIFSEQEGGDTVDKKFEKIACAIKEHECAESVEVKCAENGKVTFACDGKEFSVDADIKCAEDGSIECCDFAWDTKIECGCEGHGAHKTGGVADEADDDKMKDFSAMEKKCKAAEMKCAELEKKCAELEESNKAYMAKCEEMADYEELKKFKCEAEAKMAEEEKMKKCYAVFQTLADKGIEFSEDTKKDLEKKFADYTDFTGWENMVKAFALDNGKTDDGVVRIAYPAAPEYQSVDDIWDSI